MKLSTQISLLCVAILATYTQAAPTGNSELANLEYIKRSVGGMESDDSDRFVKRGSCEEDNLEFSDAECYIKRSIGDMESDNADQIL